MTDRDRSGAARAADGGGVGGELPSQTDILAQLMAQMQQQKLMMETMQEELWQLRQQQQPAQPPVLPPVQPTVQPPVHPLVQTQLSLQPRLQQIPKPPTFNPNVNDFATWAIQLNNFFDLYQVEDDRERRQVLMLALTEDVIKVLTALTMGQLHTKSYNELFGLLKERHVKKAILPMRRDAFLKARQKGSQTVDEWQTDVCKLAVECEFGTLLESMMLTVFLGGLRDDRLRIHLHAKELTTLWEAVDAARLYEAQRCLPPNSTQQEQPQEVYALNQRWQGHQQTWKGRSQTDSESDSSGEEPLEQKTQYRDCKSKHKERGKSFPGRCFNCNEYGHRASACKKPKKRKAKLNAIYALQETSLAYLTLRAGESKVRFQVDTGTTLTVFTNEDWYAIGRPKLKAPSYEARSYSGHAVKLKGEMELDVFLRGRRHRLKAFVADDVEHSIVGREWLKLVDGWEQFKERLKEQPDFELQQGRIEYVNFVKRAIPQSQQQLDVSSLPPSRDDSLRRRLLLQDVSSSPPSRDDSFRRRLQRTTSLRRCANRHNLPTQVKSLLPLQPLQNDSPLPPSRDDSSSSLPTLKDSLPSLPSQPSRNDSLSLPPTLDYSLPPQPLRDASSPSLPSRGRLPPPTLNDRPLDCSTLLDCLLLRARREPSMPKSKEKGRKRKKKLAELAEEVAELNHDTAEDPPV